MINKNFKLNMAQNKLLILLSKLVLSTAFSKSLNDSSVPSVAQAPYCGVILDISHSLTSQPIMLVLPPKSIQIMTTSLYTHYHHSCLGYHNFSPHLLQYPSDKSHAFSVDFYQTFLSVPFRVILLNIMEIVSFFLQNQWIHVSFSMKGKVLIM